MMIIEPKKSKVAKLVLNNYIKPELCSEKLSYILENLAGFNVHLTGTGVAILNYSYPWYSHTEFGKETIVVRREDINLDRINELRKQYKNYYPFDCSKVALSFGNECYIKNLNPFNICIDSIDGDKIKGNLVILHILLDIWQLGLINFSATHVSILDNYVLWENLWEKFEDKREWRNWQTR